MSNKEPLV